MKKFCSLMISTTFRNIILSSIKGTYLGEFEEIVLLTIGVLHEQAYGVSVLEHMQQKCGRSISIGALHTALGRLEQKGFIRSSMGGATKERGEEENAII